MIDVLERVLMTTCSPGAARLEVFEILIFTHFKQALTEIRQLVDSFYQSDCGLEYLQAVKDHRNQYYSRPSLSFSSPGSFSALSHQSTSPLPSFYQPPSPIKARNSRSSSSIPSTTVNNMMHESTIDIEAQPQEQRSSGSQAAEGNNGVANTRMQSSRQSLSDIFDLMFESPSQSVLEQLSHSTMSHQKLMAELEYVYKTIEENDTWKLVDELYDPVIILTAKEPHFILKCSMSWLSMIGCKSSQVFGKIIENFIYFPEHDEGNTATSSTQSQLPQPLMDSTTPNMPHHEVISTLEYLNHKLSSYQSNHIHCVLPLQHCQTSAILKSSIHFFPIYKKLSDEELSETEKPRYFLQRSGRDSSSQINHSIAFYIMYFNHFVMEMPENGNMAPSRLRSLEDNGATSPSVSTTEMSPISSQLSSTSMSTNMTEKLRKQGLANDL